MMFLKLVYRRRFFIRSGYGLDLADCGKHRDKQRLNISVDAILMM